MIRTLFNNNMRCLCLQFSRRCFSKCLHRVPIGSLASNTCDDTHHLKMAPYILITQRDLGTAKTAAPQEGSHLKETKVKCQQNVHRFNGKLVARSSEKSSTWITTSEESITLYSSPHIRLLWPLSNILCLAASRVPSSLPSSNGLLEIPSPFCFASYASAVNTGSC